MLMRVSLGVFLNACSNTLVQGANGWWANEDRGLEFAVAEEWRPPMQKAPRDWSNVNHASLANFEGTPSGP